MVNNHNQQKFDDFRNQYKSFVFEDFSYQLNGEKELNVSFHFHIDQIHTFRPTLKIPFRSYYEDFYNAHSVEELETMIFHIGMVELISYWKAACPKNIIIKPFALSESQTDFWRKIYFNGLGEFFYTNNIQTDINSFATIVSESDRPFQTHEFPYSDRALVPVGGGKDSNVTLMLAEELYNQPIPLILNPRGATLGCIEVAGFERSQIIEIQRTIDPALLKLNAEGYLNGHTPFSALLAFITLLTGTLAKIPHVLLSNESSANESTVIGSDVNHQYSKSFEFEADFRDYVHANISPNFDYYSFLRPLSELHIAALFSTFKQFHPIFKSCNVGSKTDIWCCNCSKCLFTFTILSAFIPMEELVKIYGENLFEKESLMHELKELTGLTPVKPFECVGTTEEVNLALWKVIQLYGETKLPLLLDFFKQSPIYPTIAPDAFDRFMDLYEPQHFLSTEAVSLLKERISCVLSTN